MGLRHSLHVRLTKCHAVYIVKFKCDWQQFSFQEYFSIIVIVGFLHPICVSIIIELEIELADTIKRRHFFTVGVSRRVSISTGNFFAQRVSLALPKQE